MKIYPTQLKFKKYQKFNSSFLCLNEQKKFYITYMYGLKFLEAGFLTNPQLEACRKVIKRGVYKSNFYKIDLFCSHPITQKTIASRMGKGKGNFKCWVKIINRGSINFQLAGLSQLLVKKILLGIRGKLPFKTKIIKLVY